MPSTKYSSSIRAPPPGLVTVTLTMSEMSTWERNCQLITAPVWSGRIARNPSLVTRSCGTA
jgi:hypothetical protein